MIITDLSGLSERLTDYKSIERVKRVNGEDSLSFLLLKTERNAHSFDMVQDECVIEYDDNTYRIKHIEQRLIGDTPVKQIQADHAFFDIIDTYQYTKLSDGAKSIQEALSHALANTPYTHSVVDVFSSVTFSNFGDDNALSLFKTILERYQAEYKLVGNDIRIHKKIGVETDFQFRYKHNIKTFSKTIDTSGLSTYIKGYGKQNDDGTYAATAEYTSPMADVYGVRHAKPVYDERFTNSSTLLDYIKSQLNDTPHVSITVDFADLSKAGYPFPAPGLGDCGYLIVEPSNIDDVARIMEIRDYPESPKSPQVTLANFNEDFADVLFKHTKNEIEKFWDPNSNKLKYNVLDEAVRVATEALKSAQTELEFSNGIIAREKDNVNKLVLFNSAGLGISVDGGSTFKTAITADGIVADVITSGQLNANNITVIGTLTGALLQTATTGKRVKIQLDDYAAYDSETQKISMGFRPLSGGSVDVPRFALGANGMDNTSSTASGNYFVMTPYPANDNPQGNLPNSYVDFAYRSAQYNDYSNIKMYDDGDIRIAALRDLVITSNFVGGSYVDQAERILAKFSTSSSAYYNSHLRVGAVVNDSNAYGLVLGDDRLTPFTRVRVQTDDVGGQYFRPVTDSGSIQLGSPSFPWEAVYAVNGTIQSSSLVKKSDIKQIQPYDPAIGTMTPMSITTEDAIEFINNLKTYTYVYKKGEEYLDANGEVQTRLVDRTVEEAIYENDYASIQLGIIADENINSPMAHFVLTGKDETLGVQVMSVLTAVIIDNQAKEKRIKALEQMMGVS
ncbi:phage tail protein [Litchfieldia alkalitelluris]|uniref:phage tail protein n=1 Tax=Litchfieldia alkalitelluris TaxID=304268 RepID=UPI0009985D87|nr:phage tail protein [Litchfieldia alkalitelluris]